MNWTELSIIINHEAVELATNILENHGSNGVVIEDSYDLINQPEDKYGEIYALKKEDYPDKGVRLKAYFNELTYDDKLRQHSVIDVGTGSGILSIASYLIGVKRIKALDIDEMAVSVAKENFRRNHCETLIEAVPGNLLKDETEKFDIVIANILAHIIDEMIDDAYNTLNEGGYFITSGIIKEKYEGIQSHMERVGFKIISEQHDNGWVCLVGQKVSE